MATVILALGQFSILVIIPAAAATYMVAGLILGLVPREDARALLYAVRRKGILGSTPTAEVADMRAADLADSIAADSQLAEIATTQLAIQLASGPAGESNIPRRGARSAPLLASYYAVSKPAQRARLVTRAKPSGPLAQRARISQGPTRQSKRHAVTSQPLGSRHMPAVVRIAAHLG
jgi:hypothetical protein